MSGQMSIFDYVEPPKIAEHIVTAKCMGCKYRFFKHGKSEGMGCELAKDIPCTYTPRKKCGTCKHFQHYVSGLGEIYHGTSCVVDAPFAVDVYEDNDACEKWEETTEEVSE